MAKIIEFYIPKNFRKPIKWVPQLDRGKVIEFSSPGVVDPAYQEAQVIGPRWISFPAHGTCRGLTGGRREQE